VGDNPVLEMSRKAGGNWTVLGNCEVTFDEYPVRIKLYKLFNIVTLSFNEYSLTTSSFTDGLLGPWTRDMMASFTDVCFIPRRSTQRHHMGFIEREGNKFMLLDHPFYIAGFNNYYQMVYAADENLRIYVDEVQEKAAAMGLTVMRTWAFNDGVDEWNALQTSPGVYQEYVFQGLDYALHKASQVGLRVILVFVNNWDDYGGMNQYVEWSETASTHDDFYTDENCRQWYKDHVNTVLNRVNTFNDKVYKEDPVIFAWGLANEPWCQSDPSGDKLQEWIETMSTYVKSLDPVHLVTIGSEGFYGPTGPDHNPCAWMGSVGVDFIRNHSPETIDFAAFHAWPDHWGIGYDSAIQWAIDHVQDTEDLLGKPVVIEEFGKHRPLSTRDQYYQGWYDVIYDSANQNLAAGGSLFWILYHDEYPDYDGFGVYYPEDISTIEIIENEAIKINRLTW
jgi:mannan endo-1,4-beta-mannosidase